MFALHEPVECVLEKLGVGGEFVLLGGGNDVAIVGAPDFSWISRYPTQLHPPKIIVRVLPVTACC